MSNLAWYDNSPTISNCIISATKFLNNKNKDVFFFLILSVAQAFQKYGRRAGKRLACGETGTERSTGEK
jgi:hypothetical protein